MLREGLQWKARSEERARTWNEKPDLPQRSEGRARPKNTLKKIFVVKVKQPPSVQRKFREENKKLFSIDSTANRAGVYFYSRGFLLTCLLQA